VTSDTVADTGGARGRDVERRATDGALGGAGVITADIVVIGAGAAGLWAAEAAARGGASVLVLEKTPRPGTKVLASGGTRCNLTTTLAASAAARLFGAGESFILPSFRALPPQAVRDRFHRLGVPTVEEPELEKVFPASQRAMDVRDALVRAAVAAGVRFQYRAEVQQLAPTADGWVVTVADAAPVQARRLILAPGGRSYPKTGTTGDGYGWLRALDLEVVPTVPALVPLTSDAGWVHELSGIAVQDAEARVLDPDGRIVGKRRRPVLFTHQGLSGPGAMDLSAPVARAAASGGAAGWKIAIDLMPELSLDALRATLQDAAARPGAPRLARLIKPLPARLLAAVTRQAELDDDNPALNRVDRRRRNLLVDALKGLLVPVHGTSGWDKAEVTAGGLALSEVDRTTLQVRRYPGLYAIGEILDLTGPIGGLNFQAAFSTGEVAGTHAARHLA
jgi:predicted Rossmann fold flavoprotein